VAPATNQHPAHAGEDAPHASSFIAAARTVASITILSRLAGLTRDAVCSRAFGAGAVWSAFTIAFLIPNLFRRLFGEGALAAAFVPEYARLLKRDPELAARFASACVAGLVLLLSILTLLGELLLLALLQTPLEEAGGLTIRLTMVMLPFMPLVCATALVGGILQTHSVFAPTAAAPILLNLCIIAAAVTTAFALGASLETAAFAVAGAVVFSGVLQLAWSLLALRGHDAWGRPARDVRPAVRRLLWRMGPVAIGLGAFQLNTLLDGLIAGWPVLVGDTIALPLFDPVAYPLDEAAASILFFAQRLFQFPLGVLGLAIATAIYPTLARHADEPGPFSDALVRGLRLGVFLGLPAAVGLAIVRHDLAAVIFQGARFTSDDAARVATALLAYTPAIPAYFLIHLLTRACFARDNRRLPILVGFAGVGVNLIANVLLIWPFAEAGLALATSLSALLQVGILLRLAPRRLGTGPIASPLAGGLGFAMIAAAVMGGLLALLLVLSPELDPSAWIPRLVRLLIVVAVGGGLYAAFSRIAGREELRWVLTRTKKASRP